MLAKFYAELNGGAPICHIALADQAWLSIPCCHSRIWLPIPAW